MSKTNASRQVARAAGTVMVAFALSSLIGLVRQILVANAFGASIELDAFLSANRVSETMFNLVAGGALASAFLPTFTTLLTRDERSNAWRLASAIANIIVLVLSILGLLVAFFAPGVVRYALATGFTSNPEQFDMTVNLLRLMLPSAVIFALSGLVMSILNSHQIFLIPALAPAMYQVGLIFGVTVLRPLGVYGLAIGTLIGALLHLGLQIPSLLRLKGSYYPILGLEMPAVREVIRLMLPRLLGVAVVQLNFWVNTNLASRMQVGSVTAVTYGFALMLMTQIAIAQSIATAALPTFSAQVARGQFDELRDTLGNTLRWLLLLSVPAAAGLMLLSVPIVSTLYERGNFTSQDTQLVSWALFWFAAGLVGHSLVEILSRAFYSLHDTMTPVLVGVGAMSLNILFSLSFSYAFSQFGWIPLGGLALANSTATALEMVVLLYLMRKRLKGLGGRNTVKGLVQAVVAAGIMAVSIVGWLVLMAGKPAYLLAIGGVVLGIIIYTISLYIMGTKEIRLVVKAVTSRLV
jgi:putative peptidoglycan lipid II flippase